MNSAGKDDKQRNVTKDLNAAGGPLGYLCRP